MPQGLIFYHFGTKQDLLLTMVRERSSSTLAGLFPDEPAADPQEAIAELWRRLRTRLGTPTPMQRIMLREIDTHPALREHARQFLADAVRQVAAYLAGTVGHAGPPTAEHLAAARLLTVTAAVADLTHGDGGEDVPPEAVARILTCGLGTAG